MKRRSRGFTLMELMVVVSLAAVILTIGVPNFRDFQRNNRVTVAANDVLGLLISSRGEALRRQATVTMCTSADPTNANAMCGAGGGWISFIDTDGNCSRSAGEELVNNAVVDDDVIATRNGSCISFATTGFRRVIAGQPATQHMMYCDERGNTARTPGANMNSAARGVEVLPTGRGTVIKTVDEMATWAGGGDGVTCP